MTREEAIKVLNGILHLNYRNFWDKECDEAIDMAIEALTNVQNMHKGEWIKYESPVDYDDGKDAWDCSLCGAMVGKPTNFCPNCGADMRGENNECK